MITAFPKIFAIGTDYIKDIFNEEVEVTEKVDGSQFAFGKIDGEFFMRSKGRQIFPETPDKMFKEAVDYALSLEDKVEDNTVYYCEYLRTPRHNMLTYERIPKNHLALFAVSNGRDRFNHSHIELTGIAKNLDIEVVPLLYKGRVDSPEELLELLEKDSILGGVSVEGIVAKNFDRPFLLGGQPIPLMAGKFVSEKFKEVHREQWGKKFSTKGKWETFLESFKTEARWHKAVQHLKEAGELENAPRDIGKLIKEIQSDISDEEKEDIKEFLWKEFGGQLLRHSTRGFAEWYKEELMKNSFKPVS